MDFYQYTTGILSFITFLVIGWQIFTIIDNGRANRKYTRSLVRDLEVKTKTMMASAKADVLMTIAIRCRNNGTLDGFNLALEAVGFRQRYRLRLRMKIRLANVKTARL